MCIIGATTPLAIAAFPAKDRGPIRELVRQVSPCQLGARNPGIRTGNSPIRNLLYSTQSYARPPCKSGGHSSQFGKPIGRKSQGHETGGDLRQPRCNRQFGHPHDHAVRCSEGGQAGSKLHVACAGQGPVACFAQGNPPTRGCVLGFRCVHHGKSNGGRTSAPC